MEAGGKPKYRNSHSVHVRICQAETVIDSSLTPSIHLLLSGP